MFRSSALVWIFWALTLFNGLAHAQMLTTDGGLRLAPPRLEVQGGEAGVPMLNFARVLEDRSGDLTFDRARLSEWQAVPTTGLSFGFSHSTWWVRWTVANISDRPVRGVVDLGHPCQDYVEWITVRQGRVERVESTRSGDRLPFAERKLLVRTLAQPLYLAAHEQVELFVRLQSQDGLFEPLAVKFFSRDAFNAAVGTESLFMTLYFGALLAFASYNVLLYAATRVSSFGAYALYVLCFLAWNFSFRGYAFQYLWPNAPDFNNRFLTVGVAWTFASIGFFAIVYLRMRESVPRWVYRLNHGLVTANLAVTGIAAFGPYALGAAVSQVAGIALVIVTQATAIWLLNRGSRQARFFVIAFALITVGVGAYILQIIAVLPTNWFTTWAIQIGSALEMLLLALGVADSMNTLKAAKLQAERQAREAQEALNAQLAQQVNERDAQLAVANRRLHELAVTDELTGAFNRRHYSAYCGAALAHRADAPLAFCIFDLDDFRSFNESRGHHVGDETLRRVAHAARLSLDKTGAVLFRLGGEEFGALFTAGTPDAAAGFAERLRQTLHDLNITHEVGAPGTTARRLTASFGVGWWDGFEAGRLTADQIYAVADNMLFEAKEAGRDCIKLEARFAKAVQSSYSIQSIAARA